MAAVCRFLPGLRIAIAAACACSGTSPFVFSSLSLASSFVWAGVIMGLVTWAGPSAMGALGLARGWALAVSIGVTLVVVLLLRRVTLTSED
jgi:membrane protein DedA with SNARE-associated domain